MEQLQPCHSIPKWCHYAPTCQAGATLTVLTFFRGGCLCHDVTFIFNCNKWWFFGIYIDANWAFLESMLKIPVCCNLEHGPLRTSIVSSCHGTFKCQKVLANSLQQPHVKLPRMLDLYQLPLQDLKQNPSKLKTGKLENPHFGDDIEWYQMILGHLNLAPFS